MQAYYKFRFYELDQPLTVGDETDFVFFLDPHFDAAADSPICHDMILVFANTLSNPEVSTIKRRCRIESIFHPKLGKLIKIDTIGLDYRIVLEDGDELIINAEECPGKVKDHKAEVADWSFLVELTPLD